MERGVTIAPSGIQIIIKTYFEKLFHKIGNFKQKNEYFYGKQHLPKANQDEKNNLNIPITPSEIETVTKRKNKPTRTK